MKRPAIFLIASLASGMVLLAQEAEKPFAAAILEQALKNMSGLKGYHVQAEISTRAGKASVEGELRAAALLFKATEPGGTVRLRILAEGKFFLSLDEGATWKTDEAADEPGTIVLLRMITGPVQANLKTWEKAEFMASEEKVNGEDLLHLEKLAVGREPAVHFWLAREPAMQNAVFVRKASMTITADDGDYPVVVTYTNLNMPAEVKSPLGQ